MVTENFLNTRSPVLQDVYLRALGILGVPFATSAWLSSEVRARATQLFVPHVTDNEPRAGLNLGGGAFSEFLAPKSWRIGL